MANLYVRRLDTREIVHTVDVGNKSESQVERVLRGMLINMNTDEYFIDDDEVVVE